MLVCIDPGHGGKDPGAMAQDGTRESFIALQLALTLRNIAPYDCILTRETDDVYPTLTKRCLLANTNKADIFLSIHVNAADNSMAHGIETLCYKTSPLAKLIQTNLIAATKARDRSVKVRRDLTVLKKTVMPAVLVETGFITNKDDLARLKNLSYQMLICESLNKSLIKYRQDMNL